MTRDDIIRMAREAGFANVQGGVMDNGAISDYWDCWPEQLARFAHLVAAAEREACAKVCEREAERWEGDDGPISTEARLCAIAIRNRAEGQR